MRVTQTLNTALLDDFISFADDFAQIAEREAQASYAEYAPRLEQDLQYEPESPSYSYGSFAWKSERQQRKVLALMRQQAIERGDYHTGPRGGIVIDSLRYERTHDLARGWTVQPIFDGGRFALIVSNPAASARFVVGDLNQRSLDEAAAPQQPFHAGRWPLAAQTIGYWFGLIREDYTERISDRFGEFVKVTARRRSIK